MTHHGVAELNELYHMLREGPDGVRVRCMETAILPLTGGVEGRTLLQSHGGIPTLSRLIGDGSTRVGEAAVKSLINLAADGAILESVVATPGLVTAVMDCLRDSDCPYRRSCLMLLVNVASSQEGCARIMQANTTPGAAPLSAAAAGGGGSGDAGSGARATGTTSTTTGLHLRRLIQLFLQPLPPLRPAAAAAAAAAATGPEDAFEHAGSVLASVSCREDARALLLEPDRRLLPVLFTQLSSPSRTRRAGVAATLRNCAFVTSPEALAYMLSPSVDLVTALLTPLAGPGKHYAPDETPGMHPSLSGAGEGKTREGDGGVRQSCVEALAVLARGSRAARDHLRAVKAYYVVRAFHWWLEGVDESSSSSGGGGGDGEEEGRRGDYMVVASNEEEEEGEGEGKKKLTPEDTATIDAINELVQQLYRDDEVPLPPPSTNSSSSGGRGGAAAHSPTTTTTTTSSSLKGTVVEPSRSTTTTIGGARLDETGVEAAARRLDELSLSQARAAASTREQDAINAATRRALKYATVPADVARERARAIATGEVHGEGGE